MHVFRSWPLAAATAVTMVLSLGAADARGGGGGHSGGIAGISAPSGRLSAPYSPAAGLPGSGVGAAAAQATVRFGPPGGLPGARATAPPLRSPGASPAHGDPAKPHPSPTISIMPGSSTASPPFATPDAAAIPSEIGTPLQQPLPIAPLAPQLQTQFATGGTLQPNMALSPGSSVQGGGGKTLGDCMGLWDPDTHMTKAEWKTACLRTMQGYLSP